MIALRCSRILAAVIAAPMILLVPAAQAQDNRPGLLDTLFGNEASREQQRVAQAGDSELVVRLERLENHIRQLTGVIEQLQFRNQQLEQQLRQLQGGAEVVSSDVSRGQRTAAAPPAVMQAQPQPSLPQAAPSTQAQPAVPSRRPDVFDPAQNPNAPGAPRPLGTIPSTAAPAPADQAQSGDAPIGAPGGRVAGAPLDLSTLAATAAGDSTQATGSDPSDQPALLPPPPPRNLSATGAQVAAVEAPSASPKDEYDLAYGYILRKDYALAETAFNNFLRRHPGDRLTPEAHYWLGESMFQRQRYRDSAEAFLTVTTKYDKASKAPDALLRLAQSLAGLGEKEAACAALGEVGRKYPRAPQNVKTAVTREQKRVSC
jgi:tol-pal system protein YbgF